MPRSAGCVPDHARRGESRGRAGSHSGESRKVSVPWTVRPRGAGVDATAPSPPARGVRGRRSSRTPRRTPLTRPRWDTPHTKQLVKSHRLTSLSLVPAPSSDVPVISMLSASALLTAPTCRFSWQDVSRRLPLGGAAHRARADSLRTARPGQGLTLARQGPDRGRPADDLRSGRVLKSRAPLPPAGRTRSLIAAVQEHAPGAGTS